MNNRRWKAYAILLLTGFLFACPAPGGGGGGGSAVSSALFSHNSYTFGSSLNADDDLSATPRSIGRVLLNDSALRSQVASLLVQENGQPPSPEQITRIGEQDYSLSYRIVPQATNPGELDPANYFFDITSDGAISVFNPDVMTRTWTLEEVHRLLSAGGLRIEVSVAVATSITDEGLIVLTSNPNLRLRNSDRSETSSQVFVAISTAQLVSLAGSLEYSPAAIREVVNASLTSYNFEINASVDENNVLDQALRFPALNGRGVTSNILAAYGLPSSLGSGQNTLFYRLSNQDDIDEECGASADDEPGVIYVDNRDFQIRARGSLNHEDVALNQFSCRLSLSTDGITYRFLAFVLAEPDLADRITTGEQLDSTEVTNANLAIDDANAEHYVLADRTNSTASMCADGVSDYSPRCFYADLDLMVDDVPESPTLDFNGLEAGTVAWTSEGIGPIPFYDRANIERFPASDEQFLLNFNRTDEDAGQALDASSVNIEVVSISPNDALPAHHPLFSARNRTLNDIRDRLVSFRLDATFSGTGIVSIRIIPDRSMFDYESASVFNENGNAEYTLTLRSADLEEDDNLRQPPAEFTVRLQILDVHYEPVFVDASNLNVTQAGTSRRLPWPLSDTSAFVVERSNPRTSINTTATDDGPAISLLPDFRAFLQNRIGILSAINPETGASYEGVEYQILPATGNTGSNIVTETAAPSAEQTMLLDNIAFIDDTSVNNIASGRLIVSAPGLSASNQDTPIRMFMRASVPTGNPDNPNANFEINAPASFVISEDAADANEQLSMLVEDLASGVNASMAASTRAAGVVTETLPGSRTGSNVDVTLIDPATNTTFVSSDDVNNNLKYVLGIADDVLVNFGLLSGNFVQQLGGGFPANLLRDLQGLDENVGTSFDSSIFEIRPENAADGVISVREGREVSFLRPYTIAVVINDASADPDSPNQGFEAGISNIALVQIYPQDMAQEPSASPASLSLGLQENQDIRNLAVSLTDDVLGYAANSEFSIFSDTQALSLAGTPFSIGTGGANTDAIALLEEHLSLEIDANNRLSITNSQRLDFETAGLAAALSGFNITITDTGSYTWLRSEATNDAPIAFSDIFLSSPQATLADDNNALTIEVAVELVDVANEPIVFEINTTNPSNIGGTDFATQYSIEENATQGSMLGMLNGQPTGVATLFLTSMVSPMISDINVLAGNIILELANDPVSRSFRDILTPEFTSFTLPTDADSNSRFAYAGIDLRLMDPEALGELGDSVNFEGVQIIATTTDNRRPRQTDDHSIDIMIDDVPAALNSQDDIQTAIRAAISGEGAASAVIRESDTLALGRIIPTSSSARLIAEIPLSNLSTETDEFYRFPGGINVRRAVPELSLLSVALSGSIAELDNETIISIQAPSEQELNNPNLDPVYRLFLANRGYVEESLFAGVSMNFAASLGASMLASPTLAINFVEPTAVQGGKNLEFADADGDRNSDGNLNDVYSLTYTQTAYAEPLATGEASINDPRFVRATNISDDDGMDRTSETLDLPNNPSDFVRLVAEEEVHNTVLLEVEGRRYIARDRIAREDNDASESGLFATTSAIVPQGNSRAYVAAINLDIDVPNFNPDNARFEILTQRPDDPATTANENDGSLIRADGNRLDGDPATNFFAYWEQPLVWNRGTADAPDYQLNITQRVYNARNASNAPNNIESYNALDTLQLYRNTMQDELELSYLIRVSADDSYTNASNYAMAQFNVDVRPAGMGQGTQVLAVALIPSTDTFTIGGLDADSLSEDNIDATIETIELSIGPDLTPGSLLFTRDDSGGFTSPDIMKNANGTIDLDPNDFEDYDLLIVLGNQDGEAAGESPSRISITGLDSRGVTGTSTEANDGDLIALRSAGDAAPAAGAAVAEQMSPDFATMTGDQSVYSISYDFALAQNYDGTARFNIVVQETDAAGDNTASSRTPITINVLPVEPEPDTLGVTLVATDQSGVTTDFAEIASNASGPSDTTNAQPLSFSEIAVQAEASFTYTGLPTGADTDPGGLDRQVMLDDIVVSFEANGDPSRENPGGTAARPTEIFVFETDSTDNLLMYKNNAWGSDILIHTVTYMEPRGFAGTMVPYTQDFEHYINVDNVNDDTSLIASSFNDLSLSAAALLPRMSNNLMSTGAFTGISFMDADLAYDNNIARVLTGSNTALDISMLTIDATTISSTPAGLMTALPLELRVQPSSADITGEQLSFTFAYTHMVAAGGNAMSVRRADPGSYDIGGFTFTAGAGTPVTATGTATIAFTDIDNDPSSVAATPQQVAEDSDAGDDVVIFVVTDDDIAKAIGNRGSFTFTIVGSPQPVTSGSVTPSVLPLRIASDTNTSIDTTAGTLNNAIVLNADLTPAHIGMHNVQWRVTDSKGLTTPEFIRTGTTRVTVTDIQQPSVITDNSIIVSPTGMVVSADNSNIDIDLLAPEDTEFLMSLTYTDEDFSDVPPPSHSNLTFAGLVITFERSGGETYTCGLGAGRVSGLGTGGLDTNTLTITNATILLDSEERPSALTLANIITNHNSDTSASNLCDAPEVGTSITGFSFTDLEIIQSTGSALTVTTRAADSVVPNVFTGYRTILPSVNAEDVDGLLARTRTTQRIVITLTDNDPDDGTPNFPNAQDGSGLNSDLIDRSDAISQPWNATSIVVSEGFCNLPGTGLPTNRTDRNQMFTPIDGTNTAMLSFDIEYEITNRVLFSSRSWPCSFSIAGLEDAVGPAPSVLVTFSTDAVPLADFEVVGNPIIDTHPGVAGISRNGPNEDAMQLLVEGTLPLAISNSDDDGFIGNFTIADDDLSTDNNDLFGTHTFELFGDDSGLIRFREPDIAVNTDNMNGPASLSDDGNTLINGTLIVRGTETQLNIVRGERRARVNLNRQLLPTDIGRHTINWRISDTRSVTSDQEATGSFNVSIGRVDDEPTLTATSVSAPTIPTLVVGGANALSYTGLSQGGNPLSAALTYDDPDFAESLNFPGIDRIDNIVRHRNITFDSITLTSNFGVRCTLTNNDNIYIADEIPTYTNIDNETTIEGALMIEDQPISIGNFFAADPNCDLDDLRIGDSFTADALSLGGMSITQGYSAEITASRVANAELDTMLTGFAAIAPFSMPSVNTDFVPINVSGYRSLDVDASVQRGAATHEDIEVGSPVAATTPTNVAYRIEELSIPINVIVNLTDNDPDDGTPLDPVPNALVLRSDGVGSSWPNPELGSIAVTLFDMEASSCAFNFMTPSLTQESRSGNNIVLSFSVDASPLSAGQRGSCWVNITGLEDRQDHGAISFSYEVGALGMLTSSLTPEEDPDRDNVTNAIDRDDDGDGLIEIASLAELEAIRDDLDGNGIDDATGTRMATNDGCQPRDDLATSTQSSCNGYELIADIDLTDIAGGWTPIGTNRQGDRFNSTFEGNGYRINDMRIFIDEMLDDGDPDSNPATREAIGFFGAIEDATIRNVHLINASALVAGEFEGTIRVATGVGGLVGIAQGASAIRSSTVFINITQGNDDVGGLIGLVNGSAEVTGNAAFALELGFEIDGISRVANRVGGIVGRSVGTSAESPANYTNNYAVVRNARGARTGGLAGLAVNSNFGNDWGIIAYLNNGTEAGDDAADGLVFGALFGELEEGVSIISGTTLLWATDIIFSGTGVPTFSFFNANIRNPIGVPSERESEDGTRTGIIGLTRTQFMDGTTRFTTSTSCAADSRAGSATNLWNYGSPPANSAFPTIACFTSDAAGGSGISISQQQVVISQLLVTGVIRIGETVIPSDDIVRPDFATIIAGLRQ